MKIHLTSAVLSYKVDWGRSPGVGHLPFYFCPHCRVIGRLEHAASPPTNVVSSCTYLPALSPSSYAGASWDFQRKSQRKGSREGPLRPMHRLKRKGLTKRSNTKLIFVFYFLSHNLFIKFIITSISGNTSLTLFPVLETQNGRRQRLLQFTLPITQKLTRS